MKNLEFSIKGDDIIIKNKKTGYWQKTRLIV